MRFACRPVGLDFIESAPLRFVYEVALDASSEEVFDILAATYWRPGFVRDIVWTSPEPHGVGSTRTVVLNKWMGVCDKFIVWDPGKRFTFYIKETTVPLARALCEDYRLEPAGSGKTRLTYVVACEPTLLLKLAGPVARKVIGGLFGKVTHGLADFVKKKGDGA